MSTRAPSSALPPVAPTSPAGATGTSSRAALAKALILGYMWARLDASPAGLCDVRLWCPR